MIYIYLLLFSLFEIPSGKTSIETLHLVNTEVRTTDNSKIEIKYLSGNGVFTFKGKDPSTVHLYIYDCSKVKEIYIDKDINLYLQNCQKGNTIQFCTTSPSGN